MATLQNFLWVLMNLSSDFGWKSVGIWKKIGPSFFWLYQRDIKHLDNGKWPSEVRWGSFRPFWYWSNPHLLYSIDWTWNELHSNDINVKTFCVSKLPENKTRIDSHDAFWSTVKCQDDNINGTIQLFYEPRAKRNFVYVVTTFSELYDWIKNH